jgi:hypothetical protein
MKMSSVTGTGQESSRGVSLSSRWGFHSLVVLCGECLSVREFEYEWSDGYTLSQELFQQAVLSGDPQALIDLWHSQPSHIDTMLQLAEYFRTVGQKDACADFVQRCLYVLESGWHVAFKPWETHCRLSYACIPNRAFFLTLFRHMQLIGRAGCSRTATEIGKLLLHVAPSTDPMRALLCAGLFVRVPHFWSPRVHWCHVCLGVVFADYYAIRSRQWEFVLQLAYCTGLPLPPVFLPNFTYSRALALWNLESTSSEAVPAATSALVRALLLYPHCLRAILEASGIGMETVGVGTAYAAVHGVATSHCEWSTVLSHPHFIDCGPEVRHFRFVFKLVNCQSRVPAIAMVVRRVKTLIGWLPCLP